MGIRTMSVRTVLKAHQKEVTSLCWHPESDGLLASGGYDSAMHFWDTHGASTPLESVPGAHDGPIWCLAWNPLGHLLVSGSHDYSTRFWSRARPGDSNFVDLLPKKVGPAAAEAASLAAANAPPAPPPGNVFDAGIFAGTPLPQPTPEELKAEADAFNAIGNAAEATAKAGAAIARTSSGLTMGEGAGAKDVLDASDFDAEERVAAGASITVKAPPTIHPPTTSPPAIPPPEVPPSTKSASAATSDEVAPKAAAVSNANEASVPPSTNSPSAATSDEV